MNIRNSLVRTVRVQNRNEPGVLGRLATTIGDQGITIGKISTVSVTPNFTVRDLEVLVEGQDQLQYVLNSVEALAGSIVLEVRDDVLEVHREGKIRTISRYPVSSIAELRKVYTPGVAEVCRLIEKEPEAAYLYTGLKQTVAIVTDGTAILGLGNIGAVAGMPVMEGKAALMDQLGGLSGIPILLSTTDPDAIISAIKAIAPSFGAIQLEDIASPACFKITEELSAALELPVFHDDQQGTAAVTLAAVLGACRLANRDIRDVTIGCVGLGAAGLSNAILLRDYTGRLVLGADVDQEAIQRHVDKGNTASTLTDIMATCDVVIATTGVQGLISPAMIRPGQIILALSNPTPEIEPSQALAAGASFAADGRMVNNVLGFPGILRGALEIRASRYVPSMFTAAGLAIAGMAGADELVPSPLDKRVHLAVTLAVARAAEVAGVARLPFNEELLAARFGL